MNSKKGQVTIFVIIGLILLVSVGIFFYATGEKTDEEVAANLADVETVSEDLAPIRNYVEQCMASLGDEAIRIIAQHGGYLYPTSNLFYYRTIDIRENDGLYFNDEFIPYWSHSPSTNDVYFEQVLKIPTIEFIEFQEEVYIEEMLPICLGDMASLQYANDLTVTKKPEATVKIGDQMILIRLDMPIEVEGTNDEVKEYYTELNIPFKRYYDIASVIAFGHQQGMFTENLLLNLIGYYGAVDQNSLPPLAGVDESYTPVIWSQQDVNFKLSQLLQSYNQILRIKGSKNSRQLNLKNVPEKDKAIFLSSQMDLIEENYIQDAEISFIYNDFPMYSKVFGKKSNDFIIRPVTDSTESPMGAPKTTQFYDFYYDVTYPSVVEMRFDPYLEGEDPFVFMFGIETNIRKNLRWQDSLGENGPLPWDDDWVQTDTSDLTDREQYNPETEQMEPAPSKPAEIFFADEIQRLSGIIDVIVYDADTLKNIEGAGISIGIGDYASTFLGYTQNQTDGEIKFSDKMPLVNQGYLSIESNGYAEQKLRVSTRLNETKPIHVSLSKIVTKNVSVKVYDLQTNTKRELYPNETVTINIDRIDEAGKSIEFSKFISLGQDTENVTLDLIPGSYIMTATLIDNNGVIIPKHCDKILVEENTFSANEYEYIPKDNIPIKPAIWGGFEFTEEQPVLITKSKVYADNEIEFTVIKNKVFPICLKDLDTMGDYEELTKRYRSTVTPIFI